MICECRSVKAKTIEKAIRAGARTVDEVGQRCGAGTECGLCRDQIVQLLVNAGVAVSPAPPVLQP